MGNQHCQLLRAADWLPSWSTSACAGGTTAAKESSPPAEQIKRVWAASGGHADAAGTTVLALCALLAAALVQELQQIRASQRSNTMPKSHGVN
mgnify:CR=1 FL=1